MGDHKNFKSGNSRIYCTYIPAEDGDCLTWQGMDISGQQTSSQLGQQQALLKEQSRFSPHIVKRLHLFITNMLR